MQDCIFCKMANGEMAVEKVYENEHVFVINDISPKAPVHLLFIPKTHYDSLNELDDANLAAEIFKAIKTVTKKLNIKEYKTLINTGAGAGQVIFHLHVHVMGHIG